MRDRPAYLPLYVRDFWGDSLVQAMSWTERAVHLNLLMLSWEGCALRSAQVAHRLLGQGAPPPELVRAVLELAWTETPEGWVSPRLERERERTNNLLEGNRSRTEKARQMAAKRHRLLSQPCDSPVTAQSQVQAQAQEELQDPEALNRQAQSQDPEVVMSGPSEPAAPLASLGAAVKPRGRPSRPRKEATGPHAEAIRLWDRLWLESRGEDWVWDAKHASAVAAALRKARSDLGAFEARARHLLFDPPDAWMAQNASPTLLNSRWNELAVTIVNVKTHTERKQDATDAWLEGLASGRGGSRVAEGRRNGAPHPAGPRLLESLGGTARALE